MYHHLFASKGLECTSYLEDGSELEVGGKGQMNNRGGSSPVNDALDLSFDKKGVYVNHELRHTIGTMV